MTQPEGSFVVQGRAEREGLPSHAIEPDDRPAATLMRLVSGFQVSDAIYVAATLGIADHVRDGPRSSDELAAATGSHPRALFRLLRALAAVGVFREGADYRFALTPLGDCLRSDVPEPVGPWAAFVGQPDYRRAWGASGTASRRGSAPFAISTG